MPVNGAKSKPGIGDCALLCRCGQRIRRTAGGSFQDSQFWRRQSAQRTPSRSNTLKIRNDGGSVQRLTVNAVSVWMKSKRIVIGENTGRCQAQNLEVKGQRPVLDII